MSLRSKMAARKLPFWVAVWLGFSSVVCTIDALFVLLRPHTLPGGKWNYLFEFLLYNIYLEVDPFYKDLNDAFAIAQSWMNLVEFCLNMIAIIMYVSDKGGLSGLLLAFMVNTMTGAKTLLYFLVSSGLCGGHSHVDFKDWKKSIFMYIFPTSIWIFIPFLCVLAIGRKIAECMENKEMTTKKTN